MKNPIIDDRLVAGQTFAVRFHNFLKDVTVSDTGSDEELEFMKRVADSLLRWQCITAFEQSEVDYLVGVGVYDKYVEPILVTQDGCEFYEYDNNVFLYSCLKDLSKNTNIIQTRLIPNGYIKSNRLYFKNEYACKQWVHDNEPLYSRTDLRSHGITV